ncbi:MAG: hypothetical protein K0S18_1413 [Anaerocolumna sp.]|nr:hypothetical protein [Anaerocolumna sp.]
MQEYKTNKFNSGVEQLKEKVERLAMGKFEYETPDIMLSEHELLASVVAGSSYSGSFTIRNSNHTPIKGVLYASSSWIELEQTNFNEAENTIVYCIRGEKKEPGDRLDGFIRIVSDSGEIKLPVHMNVEAPFCTTSIGKIKDLFQFANLAKTDWDEALKLFQSEEFLNVFLYYDSQYILLYQNLRRSKSMNQAMEEFLIEIHKKLRITLSVDRAYVQYQVGMESFQDKIMLSKDSWGYTEISIETDAPFLSLGRSIVQSDDFLGNSYPLEFVIDPSPMEAGNHYGRIYIKTVYQTITVEIICKCHRDKEKNNPNRRKLKDCNTSIFENYLKFRTNKIALSQYVEETSTALNTLQDLQKDLVDIYPLIQIHLLLISGKEEQAMELWNGLKDKTFEWKETAVVNYLGYLYLEALLFKEESIIKRNLEIIQRYYREQEDDWRILWLLLYVDTKYDDNGALKIADIKTQFEKGCRSPILYYEVMTAYNGDPSLLHELGQFELQVIHWGLKFHYLSYDVALQFTYLTGKLKTFHPLVYRCLVNLYEDFKLNEVLTAVCSLLIKGNKRSNKYFNWFRLGVDEQLRITELYEYFMYTIKEEEDIPLPQSILLYFIYNSNLSDRKKAFLYAYVIKNKDTNPTIYRTYLKHMEQFALKQIAAHNMSANLSVVYDEMLIPDIMTPEIGGHLPYVLFKHEIFCKNPNMKGVFVVHKETTKGVYTPFVNGAAFIDIFTENPLVFLVDSVDNLYISTIEYTLNKLIRWENYVNSCLSLEADHPMLLLNQTEKALNYQKFDEGSILLRNKTLGIPDLNETYYNSNRIAFVHYYYDNYEGEQLDFYLKQMKLHLLSTLERVKIMELLIVRDLYEDAKAALKEYGFEGLSLTRLIKFTSRLLQIETEQNISKTLVNLSHYIFTQGKYNEDILAYLVKHFNGTTEEMLEIWKSATAFDMDTKDLEERLLGQMLFSETNLPNSVSVFLSFYKAGGLGKITKAFLNYNAYKYLVKDRVIQPELFSIMRKELYYEPNDIWTLALIKEYSNVSNLSEEDIHFIDFNIHKFVDQGIILPVFQKFKDLFTLPPKLNNKCFVEYKTNPAHKVRIHYQIEDKNNLEEYVNEEMKNVFMGIFVTDFVVFYSENIQYYITEEDEEGQVGINQSFHIKLDGNCLIEDADTSYHLINYILTAIDMQDEKTVMESMEQYIKTKFLISKLFQPL